MRRVIIAASTTLGIAAGSQLIAGASVYEDCQVAMQSGDRINATLIANTILLFNSKPSDESLAMALECLAFAKGEAYTFDLGESAFIPQSRAEELARERKHSHLIAETERQRKRDAEARLVALRVQEEESDAKRRSEVWLRAAEACERLYRQEPDETITNRVCLDVFLATGLPK